MRPDRLSRLRRSPARLARLERRRRRLADRLVRPEGSGVVDLRYLHGSEGSGVRGQLRGAIRPVPGPSRFVQEAVVRRRHDAVREQMAKAGAGR